jgi:hypothetical protein
MKTRALLWAGTCALVVLAARSLAYQLAPQPQLVGARLEHAVGGPGLVVTAVASVGGALALAAALVWLASLGVRERHLLAGGPRPEALRVGSIVRTFVVLWAVSCVAFAALESYLHWRAGLGFHGIHCLVGPVHRNAIPLLAALALVAAAATAAARHVWSWLRRTFDALTRGDVRRGPPLRVVVGTARGLPFRLLVLDRRTRGPPALAGSR